MLNHKTKELPHIHHSFWVGAVKSFTPAPNGQPYGTGVITHPITTFEGDKPVFTTGELPFRAYYPKEGFFRVDLPERYGQQNGFSVGDNPKFGPGGS